MGDERQERELLHELLQYAADGTLKTEMVEPAGPMTVTYTGLRDGKRYGLQVGTTDRMKLLEGLLFCARRREDARRAEAETAKPAVVRRRRRKTKAAKPAHEYALGELALRKLPQRAAECSRCGGLMWGGRAVIGDGEKWYHPDCHDAERAEENRPDDEWDDVKAELGYYPGDGDYPDSYWPMDDGQGPIIDPEDEP